MVNECSIKSNPICKDAFCRTSFARNITFYPYSVSVSTLHSLSKHIIFAIFLNAALDYDLQPVVQLSVHKVLSSKACYISRIVQCLQGFSSPLLSNQAQTQISYSFRTFKPGKSSFYY